MRLHAMRWQRRRPACRCPRGWPPAARAAHASSMARSPDRRALPPPPCSACSQGRTATPCCPLPVMAARMLVPHGCRDGLRHAHSAAERFRGVRGLLHGVSPWDVTARRVGGRSRRVKGGLGPRRWRWWTCWRRAGTTRRRCARSARAAARPRPTSSCSASAATWRCTRQCYGIQQVPHRVHRTIPCSTWRLWLRQPCFLRAISPASGHTKDIPSSL